MIKVAAIQMQMQADREENRSTAETLVREATQNGAKIILLPELFDSLYFCKDMDESYFSRARHKDQSSLLKRFSTLAKELEVVILVSYFEKDTQNFYNSLVVIDIDGKILDNYRKTHIPDGPGYEEKFYFTPGNSGFKVFKTAYALIGAGICWDQWFSETARALALMGAELIFYPTAIGSEPELQIDSKGHWQRVQMGHSAANIVPVIVANRIGKEDGKSCSIDFYGSSFMTDCTGKKIAQASEDKEEIIYSTYDLNAIKKYRDYWGIFKDRRPETYNSLCKNGNSTNIS